MALTAAVATVAVAVALMLANLPDGRGGGPDASPSPTPVTWQGQDPIALAGSDIPLVQLVNKWGSGPWDGCRIADDAEHLPDGGRNNMLQAGGISNPEVVIHCQRDELTALFARYKTRSVTEQVYGAYLRGANETTSQQQTPGGPVILARWGAGHALMWRGEADTVIGWLITTDATYDLSALYEQQVRTS